MLKPYLVEIVYPVGYGDNQTVVVMAHDAHNVKDRLWSCSLELDLPKAVSITTTEMRQLGECVYLK